MTALRGELATFRSDVVTHKALLGYLLGFAALITAIFGLIVQLMLSNHVAVVSQSVIDKLAEDKFLEREIRRSLGISETTSLGDDLKEILARLASIERYVLAEDSDGHLTKPKLTADRKPLVRPNVQRVGYQTVDSDQINSITAADLEGEIIYGLNDEEIGVVGQIFSSKDGKRVVVSVGGFLGLGEKDVAVGFDELQVLKNTDANDYRIYADFPEEVLEMMQDDQE